MNASSSKRGLKTSFRASPRSLKPIYTGGPVLLTKDGRWLITTLGEEVQITEVDTGLPVARVKGDSTPITSLALSYHTSPPTLITAHQSQILRFYPFPPSIPDTPTFLSYTRQLTKAHGAIILASTVSPDNTLLATGSSDGIVKVWDLAGGYVTHLFRGHGGPVSALKFNFPQDEGKGGRMELLTGSTDGRVRLFDLKDSSSRNTSGTSGGGGGASKAKAVLEGHVSVVRGIDVSPDGRWAITAGRDKVVLVWDLHSASPSFSSSHAQGVSKKGKGKGKEESPKLVQTIIAGEQVESVGFLPVEEKVLGLAEGRMRCWTGGDKGVVKVWDVFKAEVVGQMGGVEGVDEVEVDEDEQRGILNILYDPSSSSFISIHADQNIIYHSLSSGLPTRQLIGFNDEIIDASFLSHPSSSSSPHSHLALATNSNLIRLYSLSTFSATLLSGHKDMVLCLDKSADYTVLASGSKDNTARIWAPVLGSEHEGAGEETEREVGETSAGKWRCLAICEGHAESIGAVALSRKTSPPKFIVTASQDRTIKLWDLTGLPPTSAVDSGGDNDDLYKPRSLATLRAHEKDINSLDISPNDRFLVSGSQDKLVKIYAIDFDEGRTGGGSGASGGLKLLGTCKGHRRGVWTVRFSRTDRVVASGAADRTVKLWSLDDYTCLKTFEGHTNAVLRVDFLSAGMQLVSSASDGLVKLWNIRDESCVKTLDNHEDKVWSLAIASDESTIVSAGADSVATFWEDSSAVEQKEKNDALIANVQSEQDFTNYLALKNYRQAILLALSMSQPGRLLSLFTSILSSSTSPSTSEPTNGHSHSYTGSPEIDQVLRTLPPIDLVRLLKMVRDWNSNARTSPIAQGILSAILHLRTAEDLVAAFEKASALGVVMDLGLGDDEDTEVGMEQAQRNLDPATRPDPVPGSTPGEGKDKDGKRRRKKGEVVPGLPELMDGLIPYSERHYNRLDKLVQESYMLDYIVGEMDGGVLGTEVLDL